jgi:3-oxoacyl-[acyl-carrier protein] reductase
VRLKGKRIIVTGGSRGIGADIVRLCASEGARIAFSYSTRKESAEALLKEIPGEGHLVEALNISDESSVEAFFEKAIGAFGGLDGLVNNAGITQDQLILRMKADDFDKVVQTNLRGAFLCTKASIKPMMKARLGSIVNITSVIGQTGNAGQANYAASKAGIEGLSKSIALELSSRNVRSNCVAPGFIESEMTGALNDQQKAVIMDKIPMGRIGKGSDVAQACVFLLSDESNYITGHTLNVNGGLYM